MTSLYQQIVPPSIKFLKNLSHILQKGESWADEQKKSHDEVLNSQIAPDMKGLIYQVQSTCNNIRMGLERLGKQDHVVVEDNEKTFADLQQRISSTISWLEAYPESDIEKAGSPTDTLFMETRMMGNFHFDTRQRYVSEYMLPWAYFHISTAYLILRGMGCPLSAFDFLKDVFVKAE